MAKRPRAIPGRLARILVPIVSTEPVTSPSRIVLEYPTGFGSEIAAWSQAKPRMFPEDASGALSS